MTPESAAPEPKGRPTPPDHQATFILYHRLLTTLPPADAPDEDVSAWAARMADSIAESGQVGRVGIDIVPQWAKDYVENYAIKPAMGEIKRVRTDLETLKSQITGIEDGVVSALHDAVISQVKKAEKSVTQLLSKFTRPVRDRVKGVLDFLWIARRFEKEGVLEVKKRLTWVGNTLAFLLNNEVVKEFTQLLSDLMEHDDEKALLEDLGKLIETLVTRMSPALATIEWVAQSIHQGELVIPEFGFGLTPGRLYEFLNAEDLEEGERDFRIELLSALDRYFHGEYEIPPLHAPAGQIPRSPRSVDGKLAIQTLTDLSTIIVRTTFGFVFRPRNLPSLTAPKISLMRGPMHSPDSTAAHACVTISRGLAHPVKALSGLVLRGFWEVSSHNDALVEAVASTLAHTIGSLLESILYALLSLVEIREVYDDPSKAQRCLLPWKTRATWGKEKKNTYQAVVVKKGMLGDKAQEDTLADIIKDMVKKASADKRVSLLETLLKDYGAYLELSMVCHEPDTTDESITVKAKPPKNGIVAIDAEFKDPDPDLPIVLRAYAAGHHTIMGRKSVNQYHAELTVGSDPVKKVHVLAGTSAHGSTRPEEGGT